MNTPGCNLWLISDLWSKLIKKLGYEKVLAQGGDFGSGISTALALKHPENVLGCTSIIFIVHIFLFITNRKAYGRRNSISKKR